MDVELIHKKERTRKMTFMKDPDFRARVEMYHPDYSSKFFYVDIELSDDERNELWDSDETLHYVAESINKFYNPMDYWHECRVTFYWYFDGKMWEKEVTIS